MFQYFLSYFFVSVLGLCAGSFLNCLIYRLETGKNMNGRSFCPNCKRQLKWYDLFPVISFLILKAKCRSCRNKISIQYPLVELFTAGAFIIFFIFYLIPEYPEASLFGVISAIFWFYIVSSLIAIFIFDLKHYLIPDKILFPAIFITLLFQVLAKNGMVLDVIWAAALSSGFFLAVFLFSKGKWMGFGDVKLAVLMGLLLGTKSVIVALFVSFFLGAIIGLILMSLRRKNLKSEIPFGPFMILGTLLALLWGAEIINWYVALIG